VVPMTETFKRPTTCRKCGATFEGSRTGYTVNCPECRGRRASAVKATVPAITVCYCGKTVVAIRGVANGVVCPRRCHP
jgi:DNA-directed RNA polymerase subunit RPC12/RpoP